MRGSRKYGAVAKFAAADNRQLQSTDRAVSRLSRARISFPVLKNGMTLCATCTSAPVLGLRPVRAPRRSAEKSSETPKLDSIPATQGFDDFVNYRVDDLLYVLLIKVRVLRDNALHEFRFYHGPEACKSARSPSSRTYRMLRRASATGGPAQWPVPFFLEARRPRMSATAARHCAPRINGYCKWLAI